MQCLERSSQCQQVLGCWTQGRGQLKCGWCSGRVSPLLLTDLAVGWIRA